MFKGVGRWIECLVRVSCGVFLVYIDSAVRFLLGEDILCLDG